MMETVINRVKTINERLLNVPLLDPDDARRRKLLNILLVGMFLCGVIAQVAVITTPDLVDNVISLQITVLALLVSLAVIYLINRYWSGRLASLLFLLFLVGAATFTDEPQQVVDGRSLLWYALPIFGASILISPPFSFVIAVLSSLAIVSVGLRTQLVPTPVGMIGFFIIALVSWLAARAMERAIGDLRILNAELDQRVQDRTRELAEALQREHTIAVQNKTILESIADGVLVFDASQEAIMANPAANRLAHRDLQSLSLNDFLATIQGKARELIENWMMGRKPADLNNVRFEWDERTVSANVAPVLLPGNKAEQVGLGNVMVLRDFTREAELEKAKEVFLGMVSHELRTPMSAIQGYVDVLLATEKGSISEAGYEYLKTISGSTKQLLGLANELIDMSRMETGEIELYCQWVDLADLVNNAARIVRQEFVNRNLNLEVKCEGNLPKLYLDPNRINQILLNLLSNAYKYTSEGGARVVVSQSNGWVNIDISDTGLGIKEADQERLFERFFRASDPSVQRVDGTGLGLNITRGLIELHGGKLSFESKYGRGTTFTVTLPQNKAGSSHSFDSPNGK